MIGRNATDDDDVWSRFASKRRAYLRREFDVYFSMEHAKLDDGVASGVVQSYV